MADLSKELIQELRAKAGVSVMAIKKALDKTGGDTKKALEFLKNEEFQTLAREIAMQIASSEAEDVRSLMNEQYIRNPSLSVSQYLKEAIGKFGENIEIAAFQKLEL